MPRLRLDRVLSVGVVHPMLTLANGDRKTRVPILMYHGISPTLGDRHPYFETNTTPELFARQMRFLRESDYTTVDLNGAIEAIMGRGNGQKSVAITFDDGYRDFYTRAFPVLAEYGFKATMFIVSGRPGNQPGRGDDKEYSTWQEVREMHSNGVRIGSHTVSHSELNQLNLKELEYEVKQSKEIIEDQLGQPIHSFSYPYAFPEHDKNFVERLKNLLQTHGYANGVSTILGTASCAHDWLFLPRIPVNSYDDLRFFKTKLEGGYDWLHFPQSQYKKLKHYATRH